MWPRLINIAIGLWMMAAPDLLSYAGAAANSDRIVGPIAATFATIAIWEVTRSVRWMNLVLGLWLVLAPWVLGYELVPALNSSAAGVIMAAAALVPGKLDRRYGGGWQALWKTSR